MDQIKDRESTICFPNEHIENLIDSGEKIWFNKIDQERKMSVNQSKIQQFFIENNIIDNYKQI